MSLIFDALKKSELDRQRQASPGFVAAPLAPRRGGLPLWAWIVGALLLVNVGVLTVLLWRGQRPADAPVGAASAAPARAPAAPHAEPQAPEAPLAAASGTVARAPQTAAPDTAGGTPPSEHFSPMDSASASSPVYAPEIPVDEAPRNASSAPHMLEPLTAGSTPRAGASRRPDPTLSEPAPVADNDEVLPTMASLNLEGLPEIHLDVHVWATRPADRFVYVNMRKYHENSTLQEGPLLEHIRRDGVVLNYRGVRFLLPRQ